MSRGIDPDSVNFLIADLARLFRGEFERRILDARLSVTPAEARVLAHLARAGAIRQTRLAERLGVAPMSLSAFLDRLEGGGLIERIADPEDGRAKLARLTAAADPVLMEIGRVAAEIRGIARGDVPEAEWQRFKALATRMRASLMEARVGETRANETQASETRVGGGEA